LISLGRWQGRGSYTPEVKIQVRKIQQKPYLRSLKPMHMLHKMPFFLFLVLAYVGLSCKTKAKQAQSPSLLGRWEVHSIETPEQIVSGLAMGEPKYEFTAGGQRLKIYLEPPRCDSIAYERRGDSIFYPETPKIPAVKIQKLSRDSLVLINDKVIWRLYRKT
jgi:hypothetical protein